jgi:hypothetical protein
MRIFDQEADAVAWLLGKGNAGVTIGHTAEFAVRSTPGARGPTARP